MIPTAFSCGFEGGYQQGSLTRFGKGARFFANRMTGVIGGQPLWITALLPATMVRFNPELVRSFRVGGTLAAVRGSLA